MGSYIIQENIAIPTITCKYFTFDKMYFSFQYLTDKSLLVDVFGSITASRRYMHKTWPFDLIGLRGPKHQINP